MKATPIVNEVTFEQVYSLAQQLRPIDQARLVVRLAPKVEFFLNQIEDHDTSRSRQPIRGIFSDLGIAPSAEEIDEVQRDMWTNFGEE